MGKGQVVVCLYMEMRSGWPHPITAICVDVGMVRSASGVTDDDRVRRNS